MVEIRDGSINQFKCHNVKNVCKSTEKKYILWYKKVQFFIGGALKYFNTNSLFEILGDALF